MTFRSQAVLALPIACLLAATPAVAQTTAAPDAVDHDAIFRIKDEGFKRSEVMEIASYLTDVHGGRLAGSPSLKQAAEWTVKKLGEWGASNPRIDATDPFGRGWSNDRFTAHVLTPQPWPLIGAPKAWTPGTDGPVVADVVYAPMDSEKDLEAWKGKLKGKIVLPAPVRDVNAIFEAPGRRYTEKELQDLERLDPRGQQRRQYDMSQFQFGRKRIEFLNEEGVLAVIEASRGDGGGTIFVQQGGAHNPDAPRGEGFGPGWPAKTPTQVVVTPEHYGRLVRMLEKKVPVTIELNVKNTFTENQPLRNVLAELPGTDKADEVVMLGGHLDGWHAATSATDNATGSAVMLEAFRILKASGLKMRRTVRIALWDGEEQGLLGSRAYVKKTFADRETMTLKPEHGKLSAYFNVDNGSGGIRGIYTQSNDAVAPIFEAWMKPFENLGMTTVAVRDTSGTDHQAFDAVGLPGFQFIQDPLEYSTRTHHTNMDLYERLQAGDMMKNAVIVASFVYHAANRDAKLPRKPLPKPQPPRQRPVQTTAAQ